MIVIYFLNRQFNQLNLIYMYTLLNVLLFSIYVAHYFSNIISVVMDDETTASQLNWVYRRINNVNGVRSLQNFKK